MLNELHYFHVISGLQVADIAHDLFEGIVPDINMKLIHELIADDIVTLDCINRQTSTFTYAIPHKTSKPKFLQLKNSHCHYLLESMFHKITHIGNCFSFLDMSLTMLHA